ncbi:uroporphyrinogen-III C-methyltransferase [Desulfovibrio cuneatus]|uniref:uroporphyrinogen-III C-methyltransferase n=1 Tax=Desulfovibrio cuneatus TaxID=159728 RepID=UPI000416E24B|nr:uroporphyrinogen-III C-methyltransferase [Desulfovibrio cuneatus]
MKVYLIGAGPGDPGLFTLKGKDVLSRADVVVYDYLANDALLAFARPGAELIYVGKKGGDHTLSQDGINRLIVDKAKEGKVVARLKGGDPYMFGRGGEEAEELLAAGVAFETVPGVTSAIAGPAYAGIPLTHRSHASSVCFATGHEDPDKPESAHNWAALAKGGHTLVFFMGMKNLPDISHKLIASGMPGETPAALVRWGTTHQHRSLVSTLEKLPEEAVKQGFASPSIIVVGSVVSLHDQLNWFEQRPLYGKTVVVTRAREQASESASLLAEEGAHVIQFPTIDITPMPDQAPILAALGTLKDYGWVVFTSVNGVRHFWHGLKALGLDARALAPCKVVAVGPATAKALEEKGILPDFIPEKFVAESIAEGMLALGMQDQKILLPRAEVARDVLPEALTKAGATVQILPIYRNVPSHGRKDEVLKGITDGSIHCITFGSSSTVENFLSLVPAQLLKQHPEVKLACIGPVTAQTLQEAGLTCHIQPEDYTIPGLVAELAKKL